MSNITNTRKEEFKGSQKVYASCKTPEGLASFPHLNQPDEYMGNSHYKVDLRLDPKNPEVAEFIEEVKAWESKHKAVQKANIEGSIAGIPKGSANPKHKKQLDKAEEMLATLEGGDYKSLLSEEYDHESGQPTGMFKLRAKCKSGGVASDGKEYKIEPKIYTATGRVPLAEAPIITAGSTIRLNLDLSTYEMPSSGYVGVSVRLKDVLIVKIGQGGDAGGSNPFGGDTAYQPDTFEGTTPAVEAEGSDEDEGY